MAYNFYIYRLASRLIPDGKITAMSYSNMVLGSILVIVTQPVATVILPTITRPYKAKDFFLV
jgi:peptidoglycan biosynthesis protein MviN/MurJ (putative lipid II flippase)